MRALLPDTNADIAFMLGAADVVDVVAHADSLYLNSIVLGELLGGFAAGTRELKDRAELARFLDSPRVEVLPITADTADSYAVIYAGLRRKR
jgi:tRNA(fMet)-specific endonuclease VapC